MNSRLPLALLVAVTVALTACGDGDEQGADATPSPTAAAAAPTEPPEVETEAPVEPADQTYRVRSGDTLTAIAQRFNTTVRALVRLNDIEDPNEIRAGQELKVPADQ
jgi:LysM repeat protein